MSYSNFDSKESTVPHERENEEKEARIESPPEEWTKEDRGKRDHSCNVFQSEGDN